MKETSPRGIRLLFCLFGLFLLIGLIALGAGFSQLARSLRCKNWPTSTGTITAAKMGSHEGTGRHHSTTYSADISYDYKVGGRHYTSKRVSFGEMSASAGYAQKILDRYPVGTKVAVHYSPDDPELAVLETGIHAGLLIFFGVGGIFTLTGAMMIRLTRRAQQSPQTAPQVSTPTTSPSQPRPPVLFGLIFLFMGGLTCTMQAVEGSRSWVGYGGSGIFVVAGLLIMSMSLQLQILQNIFKSLLVAVFMSVFHWVAFVQPGGGEMWPFAAFCILVDVILACAFVHWVVKGRTRLR